MSTTKEYTRCYLCGIKIDEDSIGYLDSHPIHENQYCPVIDPDLKSILRVIILGEGESVRKAVMELEKAISTGKIARSVECNNCGEEFLTAVSGNTATCPHCKNRQYIPKGK